MGQPGFLHSPVNVDGSTNVVVVTLLTVSVVIDVVDVTVCVATVLETVTA